MTAQTASPAPSTFNHHAHGYLVRLISVLTRTYYHLEEAFEAQPVGPSKFKLDDDTWVLHESDTENADDGGIWFSIKRGRREIAQVGWHVDAEGAHICTTAIGIIVMDKDFTDKARDVFAGQGFTPESSDAWPAYHLRLTVLDELPADRFVKPDPAGCEAAAQILTGKLCRLLGIAHPRFASSGS